MWLGTECRLCRCVLGTRFGGSQGFMLCIPPWVQPAICPRLAGHHSPRYIYDPSAWTLQRRAIYSVAKFMKSAAADPTTHLVLSHTHDVLVQLLSVDLATAKTSSSLFLILSSCRFCRPC